MGFHIIFLLRATYKEYLFNLLNYNILRNNLKYLNQLKNLNTKKFITDKNLIQELNRKEIFLEIYFKDGVIKNNLQSIYDESSYISYLAENSLKRRICISLRPKRFS